LIKIPVSTYRVQFTSAFTFADAEKVTGYLKQLGISHLYASPIFKAKKGSTHGYDIADPTVLNPELGGEEQFEKLIARCHADGLNWLQDIVPNHMAYSYENQMLVDLLENGQNSRFYNFFDIEWNHPHASVRQRVLAPFLGKYYREALEGGELKLKYGENGFSINYYETRFPLKMESYVDVLSYRLKKLRSRLGMNNPDFIKYQGVLYVLKSLSAAEELDERYYQIKFIKDILWGLYTSNNAIKDFIDDIIKIYNGEREISENYDLLDKLLSDQYFRLSYWKVALEEINYRRFFTVSELISLRMENEETFNRTHSLILKYVKEGRFDGLRVDHVDGLYDPKTYLVRLREKTKEVYTVVEKILESEEKLPAGWPVEGTTGYEYLNYINGLFCYKENERKVTSVYRKFTGFETPFQQLMLIKKQLIIRMRMAGEVERLAFLVEAVSSKDRFGIDITMHGLKRALEEILTYFPIYRTYVNSDEFSKTDRKYIKYVIGQVKKNSPLLNHEVTYIGNLLLQNYNSSFPEEQKKSTLDFIMRFQQLTGPLMAKGFEDTTLYIYNRFISHNEVGGNPGKFGITREEFFRFVNDKARYWPHTLISTSTHDTKRGEDVRARLNILSEIPAEFEAKVKKWNKLNRQFKTMVDGINSPDKNDEYFLYQAMIGSYPFSPEEHDAFITRLKEYIVKSVREGKTHSAWISPNSDYENACTSFVEKILSYDLSGGFLEDFKSLQSKIAFYGMFNSLSQTLLKLTVPGVPDIYQGAEMWDFSMVDPDNRRSVDFDLRIKLLKEIASVSNIPDYLQELLKNYPDSRIKMYIIYKVLNVRNKHQELFNYGEFIPLRVSGKYAENIIAFQRKYEEEQLISIVTRFPCSLLRDNTDWKNINWEDTAITLPDEKLKWEDIFTGEIKESSAYISAGMLLGKFPVNLLLRINKGG
jgi:(1->4)-alpha-D-glucan 1-alpha-D-glucosylmutase